VIRTRTRPIGLLRREVVQSYLGVGVAAGAPGLGGTGVGARDDCGTGVGFGAAGARFGGIGVGAGDDCGAGVAFGPAGAPGVADG
jgi:hypothetical protein